MYLQKTKDSKKILNRDLKMFLSFESSTLGILFNTTAVICITIKLNKQTNEHITPSSCPSALQQDKEHLVNYVLITIIVGCKVSL